MKEEVKAEVKVEVKEEVKVVEEPKIVKQETKQPEVNVAKYEEEILKLKLQIDELKKKNQESNTIKSNLEG